MAKRQEYTYALLPRRPNAQTDRDFLVRQTGEDGRTKTVGNEYGPYLRWLAEGNIPETLPLPARPVTERMSEDDAEALAVARHATMYHAALQRHEAFGSGKKAAALAPWKAAVRSHKARLLGE